MELKKIAFGIAAAGLAVAVTAPAHAAPYQVLDGWKLEGTNFGTYANIGRLNLVSGNATVEQEVNNLGNVFVGSRFSESGQIFSLSYTVENTVGVGDTGLPTSFGLNKAITLDFSATTGVVTGLAGAGFTYNFQSGSFMFTADSDTTTLLNGLDTASGSIVGLGGTLASTSIIGGLNGDSTVLARVLAMTNLAFYDNLGNNLATQLQSGQVLFQAVTNNNVSTSAPPSSGACSFDAAATCLTFLVASAGDGYLVRDLPEPGTLALLGLGLVGGAVARRRQQQV